MICVVAAGAWLGWLGCLGDEEGVVPDTSVHSASSEPIGPTGPKTPGGQTPYLQSPERLSYYEYLPPGYANGGEFPLIIFLHGIDECGDGTLGQIGRVRRHGPPRLIEAGKVFPAIVISPQAPGQPGSCSWLNVTAPFVDYLLRHYRVDHTRIYITGLSLGGQGTWGYAKTHASAVAAIVPICGPRNSGTYDDLIDTSIWAFHRITDGTVRIEETSSILHEITDVDPRPPVGGSTGYFNGTAWTKVAGELAPGAGQNPTFTVYPSGGGHDAWTQAYNNQAMWDWLFQQRLSTDPEVLGLDFDGPGDIASYVSPRPTTKHHLNDISAELNGGTWSITGGRLQLVRTGASTADNDAGLTRWRDFPAAPAVLHITFDLGVSGWTTAVSQSGAMVLAIGTLSAFREYGAGEAATSTFSSVTVKGEGTGAFSIGASGLKSPPLAANGTLHRVAVFLNRSGDPRTYRAPNGSLQTLPDFGAALWVNGALVASATVANGATSALTDLRMRWGAADNATWTLDNFSVKRVFPQ